MFLSHIHHKHVLPSVAISALAAAVLLSGCGQEAQAPQAHATPVDVAVVQTMEVPIVSHLTGRVICNGNTVKEKMLQWNVV